MIRESWKLLLAIALGCGLPDGAPERIVLVVADTLRADHVGAYGGGIPTPQLDGLAARGQALPALASYHQTSMSMGALFTGRTPSVEAVDGRALPWVQGSFCGMARFREPGDPCLPPGPGTLAEDLSAAGYETLGVTSNPLLFRPYGFDRGFDVWREVGEVPADRLRRMSRRKHAATRTGDRVQAAVEEVLASRGSDHFFLYVHYLDVHDWILQGHAYRKGVAAFDRYLGELLATLDREGLLEDSLVIVTADHGESLSQERHPVASPLHTGNPSYETVLRVPLIIAPARVEPGVVLRGQDLRERIRSWVWGEPPPAPAPAELYLSELGYRTYRSDGWKSAWPRDGGPPLLFELDRDPDETRDVASQHLLVLARHRERIEDLSRDLRARTGPESGLDDEAAERLRALGYLE